MVVALLTLDLHIPASVSLKDKRRVLRSLIDRTRARFNVSVAEVNHQNHHQQATVAVACVGSDAGVVQGIMESVARLFETHGDAEVTQRVLELL